VKTLITSKGKEKIREYGLRIIDNLKSEVLSNDANTLELVRLTKYFKKWLPDIKEVFDEDNIEDMVQLWNEVLEEFLLHIKAGKSYNKKYIYEQLRVLYFGKLADFVKLTVSQSRIKVNDYNPLENSEVLVKFVDFYESEKGLYAYINMLKEMGYKKRDINVILQLPLLLRSSKRKEAIV